MNALERLLLPIVFFAFFLLAFAWPTWRTWRATGRNPYVLPDSDDAFGYVSGGFRVVLAVLGAYVIAQMMWPALDASLGRLAWLDGAPVRVAGWTLLALATAWVVVAQLQMGTAWRVGIDTLHDTPLVTTGLFARSRNPIFLGMRACLLGVFLVSPQALTLGSLVAGEVFMQIQVRLEEAFLAHKHGAAYAAYRTRIRRWL